MIRRALALFREALRLAEENGVCHCGSDMRTHSGWDNHTPVWLMHPEDEALYRWLRLYHRGS